MNASSLVDNTTSPSAVATATSDPWVESGAMVYVAITVATASAVIMCCTWFITHHPFIKNWLNNETRYNNVDVTDEEEEIQLTAPRAESPEELGATKSPLSTDVFTLEDSGSSSDETEAVSEDPEDPEDPEDRAIMDQDAV